ncbi:MAG: hypothetical protein G01um101438_574 [Parcubacteria group bacterium Gr01-1014_38]|nr:MAG: hypothetical protein G01um101438_574 [Parcubacteria group bacterium Gr01-1014_38]
MPDARAIYAVSAFRSLPRLLSLLDRNPLSPTYGCFHRDYWLYRTSDFPDAVRQFGVHALALAYAADLPPNPYRGNAQIRRWAIAALDFWATIQHADGSCDEFYPFERGWVGPTAFTTYTSSESLRLLGAEVPTAVGKRVKTAIRRAAQFIAAGEAEHDHLANHHAMAFLAVSTAADVLNDDEIRAGLPKLFDGFLRYCTAEGWCLEYDGADPGYLSATVSFLGKVYARHPSPELREVLEKAVEFCSYFVYPDGSYAGMLGSRNTLHFYPHGFELLAPEIPLAASVANRMASALAEGKLVPPEIMSDRYVHYRVPEFLLAALETRPRPATLTPLPYQRAPFVRVFPHAGMTAAAHGPAYTVANLAKGGVVKSFEREQGRLLINDSGWVGTLEDGRTVTSQWIDPHYTQNIQENSWTVRGQLRVVPSAKPFTLWTHLAFRLALALVGWSPRAAHWLKTWIRKSLILDSRPVACMFERRIELSKTQLKITDELQSDVQFRQLLLGGELPVRYVPQSRFFQPHELESRSRILSDEELARVNAGELFQSVRTIDVETPQERTAAEEEPANLHVPSF